jgi:hypothetical protein
MTAHRRPTTITAACDCGWLDAAAGCQGRAALHHDSTGHRVAVAIIYGPAAPGQDEELPLEYPGDPDPRLERTL